MDNQTDNINHTIVASNLIDRMHDKHEAIKQALLAELDELTNHPDKSEQGLKARNARITQIKLNLRNYPDLKSKYNLE